MAQFKRQLKTLTIQLAIIHFLVTFSYVFAQTSSNLNCNFNRGMCSWQNLWKSAGADDFNWKYGKGSQGSQKNSGANDDHGGGGGYIYIKSRSRFNRTAKIISPSFTKISMSCFEFWYYMKGRTMGHLAVLTTTNKNNITENQKMVWNLRGHQGGKWKKAKIPLPPVRNHFIVIEAFDWRKGRSGNILVDDITLKLVTTIYPCSLTPSYAAPATVPVTSTAATTTTKISTTTKRTTSLATTPPSTTTVMSKSVADTSVRSRETVKMISIHINAKTLATTNTTSAPMSTYNVTAIADETFNSTQTSNSSTPTSDVILAHPEPHSHLVGIVVSVVLVVAVLVVALVFYLRRKKQPTTMYADDCSVTMTRMYPSITSSTDYHVDYRKLT